MLTSGGKVALRSPDWDGHIVTPETPGLTSAIEAYRVLQEQNGGDVLMGRKLGGLVRVAGFDEITVSATYEVYPSADIIAVYLAERLDAEPEGASHAQALRSWSEHADALFAQAWVEVVATVA